jgi:threonine dehydrogenase-like Zn-dependent dehydrogenase
LTEIITCTQKCGTISITGDCSNIVNHIPINHMMEKILRTIVGQSHTQKYWKMSLQKVESEEVNV